MDIFGLVNNVLKDKKIIDIETIQSIYKPFIFNRALSFHMDCIFYANQMNIYHDLDNIMQHDYLLHIVRSKFRKFQKWQKLDKIEDLDVVKEYYNLSNDKAKTALKLLSEINLQELRNRLYKGGKNAK